MKIISFEEAAALIKDTSTVAVSGSGASNILPEKLLAAVENRYFETKAPKSLTIVHPQGLGDKDKGGIARFAHKGMCKRVIGGHWAMSPAMGQLAMEEEVEAYNFPQGVMAQLIRNMSARGPGVITKIGLGTYIDPRQSGGRINQSAKDDLVELIEIDGEEWMRYKPIPIDVALIRGTTADEDGYISYEEEVHYDEVLAMAAAAKNNGGIVIVQVKQLAKRETLDFAKTKIPGYLVDYVVVDPNQKQSYEYFYNPSYCGAIKKPVDFTWPGEKFNERKFIARRQAMELGPDMLVNIGVGVSNGVPFILAEEGLLDTITLSLEQGQSGGIPVMGLDAGTMINPRIILDHPVQHDLYHGGVLDATCLSAAEIDFRGNVNVSKLGKSITGCGGFIDISQETKLIVFGGTLCAKSKVRFEDGKVIVEEQGKVKKFINEIQQITFNGDYAVKIGKKVIFITERCVFKLTPEGLMLVEVAPGIDIDRDILDNMEYKPLIAKDLKEMPAFLFNSGPMGLKEYWSERDDKRGVTG
ncbi:MAG TPA: acyl CoA:acetate/3-ketoacid CoA transferase [Clostridiales bacterium]|nr:acyl CoA:acetate/3-ketoacid CoA transferase [Clostridiales bacterium]